MHVRCPHCQNPIEIVGEDDLSNVTCPECGSTFNLLPATESLHVHARTIGHFQLLEHLGTGGFGSVWKAKDSELDRLVAVKIPRYDLVNHEDSVLFLREARAAAQLRHPNIVAVHEVGRDGDTLYIVSDFVHGVTLADRLTAGPFSIREAAGLLAQLAAALHHAHESGVIHRDLKPQNVMLDGEGEPHIMDFGLAKREAGEITMTVDGKIVGTASYMSPEQARGDAHHVDRRTDIYSVGVMLFELLTGERPFRGNRAMLLHQVLHDEPPNPRKLNSRVPRDLATITLKCLEKDPRRRYDTAGDVVTELRRYLAGEPIRARPVGPIETSWRLARRNPRVALLSGSVLLLLVAVAVVCSILAVTSDQHRRFAQKVAQTEREQRIAAEDRAHAADYEDRGLIAHYKDRLGAEALAHFQEALKLRQKLAAADPRDSQAQRQLSQLYVNLAELTELMKAHRSEALGHLQKSHEIREKLAALDPVDTQAQRELSSSYHRLGDLSTREGRMTDAREYYQKAMEIHHTLAAIDPTDNEAQRGLSFSYAALGNLSYESGQMVEALDYYQKSQEINKKIEPTPGAGIAQAPWMRYREHYRIAVIQHQLKRYQEAIESYRLALAPLQSLLKQGKLTLGDQKYIDVLESAIQQCRHSVTALGDWESLLHQPPDLLPMLLDLRGIHYARDGRYSDAVQAVDKLRELGTGTANNLYNAACVYSLCAEAIKNEMNFTLDRTAARQQHIDDALETLREAIRAGLKDFDHMRKDPDLALLRDLPEFRELIPLEE